MKAIQVRKTGGPDALELVELPEPRPRPGELLVDVKAAGVNFIDVYHREGRYPQPLPFVIGLEGCGVVRGSGRRVAWKAAPGSYAEVVAVPEAEAVDVPDGVSDQQGAALLLQGLTAHYLATSVHGVQPGDWVVVHAAAGGVGLLLTQIVKLKGGHVLGTVSSAEKAKLARAAGADEIAGYDDFAKRARELTRGEGVAAVYDGVGKTTLDGGFDALRKRGLLALYGASSGAPPPFDLQLLSRKGSLFITRPTLGDYTRTRDELTGRANELLGWIKEGRLNLRVGHVYPLADARRAHEDLEARRTTGKLLLVP